MNKEQEKSKCESCIDEKHNLCWEGDLMLHCNCSCHQPNNRIREEWEKEFRKTWEISGDYDSLKSCVAELLKSQKESLVEKIEKESMRDEHKKDVQTCPTNMIKNRTSYNEGLKKGFDITRTLIKQSN